jgi:hypothetical protein
LVADGRSGPPVLDEFRPTLAELAGPHWRAAGRRRRVALIAALGAIVMLAAALVMRGGGAATRTVVVEQPVAFNLVYDAARLARTDPGPGASLDLRTPPSDPDPERFTVRPITLPPYRGDPASIQPIVASRLIDEMRSADPAFILRAEGRTRINRQPGYQIQFQTTEGGRTVYGRRTLLFPDEPGVREGADITVRSARSPAVPNVDAVGSNGPLKQPYRSFRFGTERP